MLKEVTGMYQRGADFVHGKAHAAVTKSLVRIWEMPHGQDPLDSVRGALLNMHSEILIEVLQVSALFVGESSVANWEEADCDRRQILALVTHLKV